MTLNINASRFDTNFVKIIGINATSNNTCLFSRIKLIRNSRVAGMRGKMLEPFLKLAGGLKAPAPNVGVRLIWPGTQNLRIEFHVRSIPGAIFILSRAGNRIPDCSARVPRNYTLAFAVACGHRCDSLFVREFPKKNTRGILFNLPINPCISRSS